MTTGKRSNVKVLVGLGVLFGVVVFCCIGGFLVFLLPAEVTPELEPRTAEKPRNVPTESSIRGERAEDLPPLPEDLGLEILETQTVGVLKRSLTVRLARKATEEELRHTAFALRAGADQEYERTFILYLLPGMEPGAGAWATTHFNPDLEVKILGLTDSQEAAQLEAAGAIPGEHVGRWIDTTPYSGGVIVIYRNEKRLFSHQEFADGSKLTKELVERRVGGETRLAVKENDFGEYYVIEGDGDLGIYDRDGLITTARARK